MDQPPAIYSDSIPSQFQTFSGPTALVVHSGATAVVTISFKDGSVSYGPGFTPSDGAKAFWEQITRTYPSICKEPSK